MAGIALTRIGQNEAAARELRHSLIAARARGTAYDVAATIDAMDAINIADGTLLHERDEILRRLKVERLPIPEPAAGAA
jgi:hypothetical protein